MGVQNTKLAGGGEVSEVSSKKTALQKIREWKKYHPLRFKFGLIFATLGILICAAFITGSVLNRDAEINEVSGVDEVIDQEKVNKALEELKSDPNDTENSTFSLPSSEEELKKKQAEEDKQNFTGTGSQEGTR